jgi:hypothetical protein
VINRHSSEISEVVPAHTRARAHAEITRTPLSSGGDECDADSLSLLVHMYIHRHTSTFVCLFVCFSEYHGGRRQTNRQSREISEIVPAHARAP